MSYQFEHPVNREEALTLLSQHGDDAKILAGGTAMVLLLSQGFISPGVLLSLDRLEGIDGIRETDQGVHIGALTTLSDVAHSDVIRKHYPALATASGQVGNVRIRNQATLGGNLAEADYASDPPAVLAALDAQVKIEKVGSERLVPLSEFLLGFYTTVLEPDELLTEIIIPPLPEAMRMTYRKFKTRSSEDRPCVGVAIVAQMSDGVCNDLRVAVGAATETPLRLPELEGTAHGKALDSSLITQIAEGYAEGADPLDDLRGSAWYRKQMIKVEVRRALEEVNHGSR